MLEGDVEKERVREGETPKIGRRRRQLTPVWQLRTLTYCTHGLEVEYAADVRASVGMWESHSHPRCRLD